MKSLQELTDTILEKIEMIDNGFGTQYVPFSFNDSDIIWNIRISNHRANPANRTMHTVSFVIEQSEIESDNDSNFSINKKHFVDFDNQFVCELGSHPDKAWIFNCLESVINH